MPIPAREKRKHYKALSFEGKAAERKPRATIRHWRMMSIDAHPGSWKQFLAARAARGNQRAIRRLARKSLGLAIKSEDKQVRAMFSGSPHTTGGTIMHTVSNGVRLRESPGSLELLGDAHDQALEQLVSVAKQRCGSRSVTLLGRKDVRRRLAKIAVDQGLEITQERER
jgi:hypothetical protein